MENWLKVLRRARLLAVYFDSPKKLKKLAIYLKRRSGLDGIFARSYPFDEVVDDELEHVVPDWEAIPYLSLEALSQLGEFLRGLPEDTQRRLLHDATQVTNGTYTLFSHHAIDCRQPNFNFDPLEKVYWPTGKHSSRYFQFDKRYGDIKRVWELNRLQFLDPLICGYYLGEESDRKRIVDTFFDVFTAWLDQNPHERSVAWACSQEISIRCLKLIFLYRHLCDDRSSTYLRRLKNILYLSAKHVFNEIEYAKSQRNNHAITESVYLILFATLFRNHPQASNYYDRGLKTLVYCLRDQFFLDGTYIQNSITYHRFALQGLILAEPLVTGHDVRAEIQRVCETSLIFLHEVSFGHTGDFPNFGPNDGAMLFNWSQASYRDMRPLLNQLALLTKQRPVFSQLDLLIDTAVTSPASLVHVRRSRATVPSRGDYPQGGIYTLRNNNTYVFFKCGSYEGRFPSQNDMLHMDLWHQGRPVLIDSGTFEYFSRSRSLDAFIHYASTAAHNTIRINQVEQMDKGPRFVWLSSPLGVVSVRDPMKIVGESYAYQGRIANDPMHRRTIELRDDHVCIEDEICSAEGDRIEVFWHIADEDQVEVVEPGLYRLSSGITIHVVSVEPLDFQLVRTSHSLFYADEAERVSIQVHSVLSKPEVKIVTMVVFPT